VHARRHGATPALASAFLKGIDRVLPLQIGLGLPASDFLLVGRTRVQSFLLVIRWQVTREASAHIVMHIVQNFVLPIVPTCRAACMGHTVRSHLQFAASITKFLSFGHDQQKFIC
jgi:hypothetical protein